MRCNCGFGNSEEEEEVPPHKPGESGIAYVNAYAITRHYGGPEEGGWWYNTGEPLASIPIPGVWKDGWKLVPDKKAAEHFRRYLLKNFKHIESGDIYSVLGGVAIDIYFEEHPAKYFPERRPHYE